MWAPFKFATGLKRGVFLLGMWDVCFRVVWHFGCVFLHVFHTRVHLRAALLASLHHRIVWFSWLSLIVTWHICSYVVLGLTICLESCVTQLLPSLHKPLVGQSIGIRRDLCTRNTQQKTTFRLGQCFFKASLCEWGNQFHASCLCWIINT
jgi:hypothetical protein